MKRFILYFVEHRVLFWSLMAILAAAGVGCFVLMPKLEDPATELHMATVIVPYPGATAQEVENEVAKPLEKTLYSLPNVKSITTTCKQDMVSVLLEFSESLTGEEVEKHFDLLRRRMHDMKGEFPNGTYEPIIMDDMTDVYGIMLAMTGDGYDYEELLQYAKYVRDELLHVKGIKRIHIAGIRPRQIDITLSRERLAANGLLPTQLMVALQNIGKPCPAGHLQAESDHLMLQVEKAGTTIDEVKEVMISSSDGRLVRLDDVVDDISFGFADPQTYGYFVNGEPALAICVSMEASAVVPNVGRRVDKALQEITADFPVGVDIRKVYFQPDMVSDSIRSFMLNLVESILIVLVVLAIFMGWRSGVIIGMGLFLTICGSFVVLMIWGVTLQRISLGAFIVAMGMLVDNAVVIMDGIVVDRARGLSREQYLTRIARQTAMPLLGATLIAVLAFLGIVLSKGLASEYAADLFRVMAVSLLFSWVLAMIQIPACADQWMSKLPEEQKQSTSTQITERIHNWIRRVLAVLIGHKKWSFVSAIIILALSVWGFMQIKVLFFPDFEYNQVIVECFWPEQTSSNAVRDNLLEMTKTARQVPGVTSCAASQGAAPAHYCLVRPMTAGGSCYGELMVDFTDYQSLCRELPKLKSQLRSTYPDAYIRFKKYNFSIATSHLIEVEFSGPDPAVLRALADTAAQIMRQSKYIDSYSVQNNWASKGQHLVVDYNERNAAAAHITRGDVANALSAATTGLPIGRYTSNDEQQLIYLHVRNTDGSQIEDLTTIPVWSTLNIRPDDVSMTALMAGGATNWSERFLRCVPLSAVSDSIRIVSDEDKIIRHDGRCAIEVEADVNMDVADASPDKAIRSVQHEIENIPLPAGYHFRWMGDKGTTLEIVKDILLRTLVGVALMIIVLLLLFHSWKKIGIMLVCVPFCIVGVTPALWLSGNSFTFMALLGIFGLLGMMLKNTVVLMDEINFQLSKGVVPFKAVIEATVNRTRPVLMASITTIVGVVPLVNDPMYGPMAVSIMGGLLIGTMVTLLLMPLTYSAVYHIKKED
ncbi:MAG: efflux RND transporter permease subunit [Paludibacteraceae bacterium]|nr:efflux RND transporter permease subunit [Paludibacteraceae bacterium]